MFLSIYNNRSGEEYIRRLGPREKLDLRALVRKWADSEYGYYGNPKLSFSEQGSHIPNGCADWQAELRDTKKSNGYSCWTSEPFYMELGES